MPQDVDLLLNGYLDHVGPSGSPTTPDLESITATDVANTLVPQGELGAIPDVPAPAAYPLPAS